MTFTDRGRRAAAGLLAAGLLLGAARPAGAEPSAGDVATARELYRQGLERRDRGDTAGAREKLEAAYALVRTPLIGLELCRVHASGGRPVEAREVCLGVARIPPSAEETPRSADARREAARIADDVKPRIASLRVVVSGARPGDVATVTLDGVPVPPQAASEPRSLNPGDHVVAARIGRGPESTASVTLADGQASEVRLQVLPPDEPPADPAGAAGPREPARPARRKSALVPLGFGVGGVGFAVGLVGGAIALSAKGGLDCPGDVCPPAEHDTLDRARGAATVSTVGFVVAGVGLAAALVGLAVSPSDPARPAASASGASPPPRVRLGPGGLHGTF